MSIHVNDWINVPAIKWAFSQIDMNSSVKFTLISIAKHSDDCGVCYPGINRICEDTCMSRRTVIRAIQYLEAHGYLTVKIRGGDGIGRKSNLYQLKWSQRDIKSTEESKNAKCQNDTLQKGQSANLSRQGANLSRQSATVTPEKINKKTKEQSTKKEIPVFTPPPEVNPQAWADLDQYRSTHKTKKVRDSWTKLAKAKVCNLLSPLSQPDQQHCVDMTIANGWQGIFPDRLRSNGNATNQRFNKQGTTAAERNSLHRQIYRDIAADDGTTVDSSDL
ncbi:MAG: helix-turn-helix domain-containing protein [Candidatus Thiodiazotropha sp.]